MIMSLRAQNAEFSEFVLFVSRLVKKLCNHVVFMKPVQLAESEVRGTSANSRAWVSRCRICRVAVPLPREGERWERERGSRNHEGPFECQAARVVAR